MVRGVRRGVAALGCALLLAAGCGGDKGVKLGTQHKAGDPQTFGLTVADQTSNGKTVKVPEVYFKDTKGYAVIYGDNGGSPAANVILGVSELLPAGASKDVKVKLKKQLTTSQDVHVMLHPETNGDNTFDFPPNDQPAMVNGSIVEFKIHIKIR